MGWISETVGYLGTGWGTPKFGRKTKQEVVILSLHFPNSKNITSAQMVFTEIQRMLKGFGFIICHEKDFQFGKINEKAKKIFPRWDFNP